MSSNTISELLAEWIIKQITQIDKAVALLEFSFYICNNTDENGYMSEESILLFEESLFDIKFMNGFEIENEIINVLSPSISADHNELILIATDIVDHISALITLINDIYEVLNHNLTGSELSFVINELMKSETGEYVSNYILSVYDKKWSYPKLDSKEEAAIVEEEESSKLVVEEAKVDEEEVKVIEEGNNVDGEVSHNKNQKPWYQSFFQEKKNTNNKMKHTFEDVEIPDQYEVKFNTKFNFNVTPTSSVSSDENKVDFLNPMSTNTHLLLKNQNRTKISTLSEIHKSVGLSETKSRHINVLHMSHRKTLSALAMNSSPVVNRHKAVMTLESEKPKSHFKKF